SRICDQTGASNLIPVEFRRAVYSFVKQRCGPVPLLVPARVDLGIAQPESSADIDHLSAGIKYSRRHFHGHLCWGRQEYERELFLANGVDRCGNALPWLQAERSRAFLLGGSVLEQHNLLPRV